MDVLDAEVQQGEQDDDGLLLVPGDIVGNRQLIDIVEAEDLFELQSNQREAVAVVALASVEHARDAADVAKVELDVLVLRAACRQDDRILRQRLCELCIVVAALHAAVAARHDDELLDGTALDGLDDLVRKREDLLMREAADNRSLLELFRCRALLCHLDDGREVLRAIGFRLDVRATREADRTRREDTRLVALFRRHEAVRRQQHRAAKCLEFLFLLPPGVAVVAREVVVFLEERIVMRWQHLAVRVDIDARALRLLQEHFEVSEVMAGNQDGRILADAEIDLRDLGVAVMLRVRLVKERHRLNAPLARLERQRRQVVSRKAVIEQLCKRGLEERINRLILFVKRIRVFEIRREALEAVRDELAQAAHVLVLCREHADVIGRGLGIKR